MQQVKEDRIVAVVLALQRKYILKNKEMHRSETAMVAMKVYYKMVIV